MRSTAAAVYRLRVITVAAIAGLVLVSGSASTITGTDRSDTLRGTAKADKIYNKKGNDKLFGLAGNDLLVPGPGADTVSCGSGRDTGQADSKDKVAKDCEVVKGASNPANFDIKMTGKLAGTAAAGTARFDMSFTFNGTAITCSSGNVTWTASHT